MRTLPSRSGLVAMVFVAAIVAAVGCGSKGSQPLTYQQAESLIEAYLRFRNEGDMRAAEEAMHPDCSVSYPNVPGYIKGIDALKEYNRVTRLAFPNFKMSVYDFVVVDDRIISFWSLNATNSGPLTSPIGELPPTNEQIRVSGIAVARVADGKIIEDVAYFDTAEMLRQLGFRLVPPRAVEEE